jgi:hypothetical protein
MQSRVSLVPIDGTGAIKNQVGHVLSLILGKELEGLKRKTFSCRVAVNSNYLEISQPVDLAS